MVVRHTAREIIGDMDRRIIHKVIMYHLRQAIQGMVYVLETTLEDRGISVRYVIEKDWDEDFSKVYETGVVDYNEFMEMHEEWEHEQYF